MKKVFIVAGEASGDALGAWYIAQQRIRGVNDEYAAVGGVQIAAAGATLYKSIDELSVVGVVEIIRHLPRILRIMRELIGHIKAEGYDEVVLIDFPGFNLRLLQQLKKEGLGMLVTYLSPPQLWVWGAWRVKKLKAADRVIVLYPFEVDWYAQRGVTAEWLGSPVVDRIDNLISLAGVAVPCEQRKQQVAVLPGSRRQEIRQLIKVYAPVLRALSFSMPQGRIVFIVAPSLRIADIRQALAPYQPEQWGCQVSYICDANEQIKELAHSICALTKPGTNTLELALLGVPAVVVYKTSWLTYWLARMVVKVKSMTLPNLLIKKEVYPEFIQGRCQPAMVIAQLQEIVREQAQAGERYAQRVAILGEVRQALCKR